MFSVAMQTIPVEPSPIFIKFSRFDLDKIVFVIYALFSILTDHYKIAFCRIFSFSMDSYDKYDPCYKYILLL